MNTTDPSGSASSVDPPALEVRGLSKSFGPVKALESVSFELRSGEVLGLLGDNGAGKSTLVKCVSGLYEPDGGEILVDGEPAELSNPEDARDLGIETVHQDLGLVETLDVASNLFLNRELVRGWQRLWRFGWLQKRAMQRETREILDELEIRIESVRTPVAKLSGGQRQAVAVGRAVGWGRHVVLLDEPTAALGVEQAAHVNELIGQLRDRGIAVLLISHNMQQVVDTCDRAVVLLHGRKVGDVAVADVTARDLVDLITGAAVPGDGPAERSSRG